MEWQPIENAPKDGTQVLVYYDHNSDPYVDPTDPKKLTDYAAWAEFGDFMDGEGYCIAVWLPQHWESVDEYGGGYWLPAWWFAVENSDFDRAVSPTHWMPLPPAPEATQ